MKNNSDSSQRTTADELQSRSCPGRGSSTPQMPPGAKLHRRALLVGAGVVAAGVAGYPVARRLWDQRQPVFLARNQRYDVAALQQTILDGLEAVEFPLSQLKGCNVLLKPNLVEPHRDVPQMTTHPAVIVAAAEAFRRHGAHVRVGEGPGHVRDTQMALVESGVSEALSAAALEFVDINYDEVGSVRNAGGHCPLRQFYLPRAAMEADWIVSLPKLKTHHWVGMTAAMKNLYGLLPGVKYGWPKNVLHHAGIPQSIVDINASIPRVIGIVDAIDCMEGDGPIMGGKKHLGVLAIGANLTALDATCARLMGLDAAKINYLKLASARLGPVANWQILQRGESPWELRKPFEMLDRPYLQQLRDRTTGVLTS